MSKLAGDLAKFRKEQADATSRNISHARPAAATPARVSTPKPAAAAAASASDTNKRTHDSAFADTSATVSMIEPQGAGHELLTNVNFARKYLKEKHPASKPFDEIIHYLSLPVDAEKNIPRIKQALSRDDRVEYIPKGAQGNAKEEFRYRPKVPVSSAEELKEFMSNRDRADGVLVSDIKDGWADCVPAINKLEEQGHLLVIRQKKENMGPKVVYADSPNWHISVGDDFRDFWNKTKIPATENEVRTELEKAGITPTSQVKAVKINAMKKKERKKPIRRNGKLTNTHMTGILKDFNGR